MIGSTLWNMGEFTDRRAYYIVLFLGLITISYFLIPHKLGSEIILIFALILALWWLHQLLWPIIRLALGSVQAGYYATLLYRYDYFKAEIEQAHSLHDFLSCVQRRLKDDFDITGMTVIFSEESTSLSDIINSEKALIPVHWASLDSAHPIFNWAQHNNFLSCQDAIEGKLKTLLNHYTANIAFGLRGSGDEKMVILARVDMAFFNNNQAAPLLHLLGQTICFAFNGALTSVKYFNMVEKDMVNRCGELAHEVSTPISSLRILAKRLKHESQKLLLENRALVGIENNKADLNSLSTIEHIADQIDYSARSNQILLRTMLMNTTSKNLANIEKEKFDLAECVRKTITTYPFKNPHQKASVILDIDQSFTIYANRVLIGQVVINLIKNALDAIAERSDGKIEVTTNVKGGCGYLEIHDNGCGIDEETLSRLFHTHFTTKSVGIGFGFGLPFCQKVMESVGGTIQCKTAKGHYTTMILCFEKSSSEDVFFSF